MTVARSVARNSLIQLVGRGITMSLALATLTLLSRYLGPEDFGRYQLILTTLFLVNVADFGIATVATRHLRAGDMDPDRLMGNVLTLRAVLGAVAGLVVIGISAALGHDGDVLLASGIAALSFVAMVFSGSYYATFNAELRMEYVVYGNVAQAVVSLGGMAWAAASGLGLPWLFAAYALGWAVNSAVCVVFVRQFVRPQFAYERAYASVLLRDALPLMAAGLVINAYGRIDLLLLRAFTDAETVGHYGFAYRLIDLAAPLSFLFVSSVYPLLAEYHAGVDRESFRNLYQRSHDFLSLAGISLAAGVILFAPDIASIIGGADYAAAVMAMRILALTFALIWLTNLVNHGLIAAGKQHVLFWTACLALAVNVSANLVMIPLYGKEGAAVTQALTEATVLIASLLVLNRYMGGAPSFWVAGRLLPIVGVSAVVVYVLPLPVVTEVLLVGALLGIGVVLTRIVKLDDVRVLLGREHKRPAINPAELRT
jgi:O-antigen/teichoic acid export membrane protein